MDIMMLQQCAFQNRYR